MFHFRGNSLVSFGNLHVGVKRHVNIDCSVFLDLRLNKTLE